jgi:hypothetical protein
MTDDVIERWLLSLKVRVGPDDAEAAALVAALHDFCDRNGLTPEEVLVHWEEFPELCVRQHPNNGAFPNLAVESFLIHNGVNVFGEIKCVSGTAEDLVEQGQQFVPKGGAK